MSNARPLDLFGRWGGEEFLGIIRNTDLSGLRKIGNRSLIPVEKTQVKAKDSRLNVTISICAALVKVYDTISSLIKRADTLLYKSKDKGRNCLSSE